MIKRVYWGMMLLLGLAGCNEEEPAAFDEVKGIYFNNRLINNTIVDSTNVTFVYTSANTMNVTVKVQALGRPVSYARPIDIRVTGGNAIEGTDYELITAAEMPAEAVNLDYNVQLNRTAILKQEDRELVLELRANEHFILPFEYQVQSGNDTTTVVRYRIVFSDRFTVAPESWDENFGGKFSQQKFELICRVLEIDPAKFNTTGGISPSMWQFIYLGMCDYVAIQVEKKEAGKEYDKEAFDPTTGEPLFKY
ncbi:DUF4843 domain-containing protein [Butyricimonas sp.]|uniref:DUF4843 domain-containing protein n=1 Tax=Butyricimonas sp. TaxID=1969738 RepID=UPI0025C4C05C|nr:DUF4843 domain-containing protein [Butyricimonas sp.]